MNDAARLASWHLVVEDGTVYSGGAAVAPLLELLSGGRLPAAVFRRFPGLTNRGYRWVAGHRTALAKPLSGRAVRRATARIDAHAR
jgi:predicted DCC family thiol-disulfide oxidoreductase YuxK